MQPLPAIQSQCLPGWRTSQLSALGVTPGTVCNNEAAIQRIPVSGVSVHLIAWGRWLRRKTQAAHQ
jgi:hypothetical protein